MVIDFCKVLFICAWQYHLFGSWLHFIRQMNGYLFMVFRVLCLPGLDAYQIGGSNSESDGPDWVKFQEKGKGKDSTQDRV